MNTSFVSSIYFKIKFIYDQVNFPCKELFTTLFSEMLNKFKFAASEPELIFLGEILKGNPGEIIDVGSNKGAFSKQLERRLGNPQRFYCFEPMPYYASYYKGQKFNYLNYALSNITGKKLIYTLRLKFFKTFLKGFESFEKENVTRYFKKIYELKTYNVEVKELDAFKFEPCFIKIDVEGAEHNVIIGAEKTISKYKPLIMLEINNNLKAKTDKKLILSKLKRLNYESFLYENNELKMINFEKYPFKKNNNVIFKAITE